MRAALLAALADGAGGEAGRRAVEELARALGRDTGASAAELAEAAGDPARPDAVRRWGDRLAELLAADPEAAGAVARAMERYAPGSTAAWYRGDHTDFRGGVFLREVVGVQVVIRQGAAAPEALAGLPPRPGGFTGRTEETKALLAALDPAAAGPSAVLVAAVSGLGGIGKTALAVQTAHLACGRGWFPGGVLFIDLHGYDPEPVTADRALQALLRALGVRPEDVPATADERAVLYRSVLAERARERGPVLILADNASSPDQVRPLMPGDARHHVLVTSRDRLPQLGARLVSLDELSAQEAYGLLDLAVRIADPDDPRIADDPAAAERLAVLCGHLPLALQIAAALLAEDPGMPVTELVAELAESHDRLDHLDDGERSVRAAFAMSYRRLPAEQARLLRLLALAPGPEASDEVVAALVGAEAPPVRDLKALARAHLVERGSGRGRWRLHDLVRAFGVSVVAEGADLGEEAVSARVRVLEYYFRWADEADNWLTSGSGGPEAQCFADRSQALAWFDRERTGLVSAAHWAREEPFAGTALRLATCLDEYLSFRWQFDDLITVARLAREDADRSGNVLDQLLTLGLFGSSLRSAGRTEEAIEVLSLTRDLFQTIEDPEHEANAWDSLGLALRSAERYEEAVDAHTRARELYRATDDSYGEGLAWNNLGSALQGVGRLDEAIAAHRHALDLLLGTPDRQAVGMTWHNLGIALEYDGRWAEAVDAYGQALHVCWESEDWYGGGETLKCLALAHEDARRPAEACTHWLRAADAFTRADAPTEAAQALARADALGAAR
ncbi:tetratricopeptide repeat protein [Streptomyces cyanogenus]|uniref:Regulatory protein AfsR n=1 Tax=Streptomyces cyanogenus TaxID=80860 RepID=A0ABX7TJ15_STRCY|nr:tetratricopeptide repeat protein [Streptomyces cyanogenus]QTD96610.1 Regulatory protein AfsR [Streptomyces cyanogenus]